MPTQKTNSFEGDTYGVIPDGMVSGTTLAGTWEPASGKDYGSVNGAQLQYLGPAVTLDIRLLADGQVQLQWPQGTLLESTSLTGPWTTNSAASPYTLPPAGDGSSES